MNQGHLLRAVMGAMPSGLAAPSSTQNARVAGMVEQGIREIVAAVLLDARAGGFFLRRADFDDEIAGRFEVVARLGQKPVEYGEAVRSAVERDPRFIIADAWRQLVEFRMRNIRRIAQDEMEAFVWGEGRQQIALEKANSLGHAMFGGVARGQ